MSGVCYVRYVYCVETSKHIILKLFSPSGSYTIPVFPYTEPYDNNNNNNNNHDNVYGAVIMAEPL